MVPCTESTLGWSLAIFGDVSIHLTVEALLKLMIPVIPAAGRLSTTPTDITYVGWLIGAEKVKDQVLQSSALVVEFDDDRAANTAIGRGLVLCGKNHTCVIC